MYDKYSIYPIYLDMYYVPYSCLILDNLLFSRFLVPKVYIQVHTHMYKYIHKYIHIHTHTQTHTYSIHIHTCITLIALRCAVLRCIPFHSVRFHCIHTLRTYLCTSIRPCVRTYVRTYT